MLTHRCTNLIQSQTRSHQLSSWRWWLKLDFWCIIWMTTSAHLILNMIRCRHIRLMTANYPHCTPSQSLSPGPHWPTLHLYLVISRETYTQECHYSHYLCSNCNKIHGPSFSLIQWEYNCGHTVWLFQWTCLNAFSPNSRSAAAFRTCHRIYKLRNSTFDATTSIMQMRPAPNYPLFIWLSQSQTRSTTTSLGPVREALKKFWP